MELKLVARRPRWWERKWKPKKPILYLIEQSGGKLVNTYWWGGNWRSGERIKFCNSGWVKVSIPLNIRPVYDNLLVVGRSGTTLNVNAIGNHKIRSLNPNTSDWTCFGSISRIGIFTAEVSKFNLEEKIKESNN